MDFESWLAVNKELNNKIPFDHLQDIKSFDYRRLESVRYIKIIIKKLFDWQEFERWRTVDLLQKILEEKIDIVLASRILKEFYYEQEEELEFPFLTSELSLVFESLLDHYPDATEYHLWEPSALKKELAAVENYKTHFFEMVTAELNELLAE